MHFAIQKDVLVKALRDVGNAIATRVVQPVLSNVLIESLDNVTLRFTGTDLDLTIRCNCPAVVYTEGSITLPGKKLLEVVSKLPNDLVSFQVSPDTQETTVTCQKSKFSLAGLLAADYPKLADSAKSEGFLMPTDILRRAIVQTSFAAATYDVGSILGGVYLLVADGAFEATATDGSRLAHRHEELSVSSPVSRKADSDKESESESKAGTVTMEKPQELKAIVPARACTEMLKIFDSKDPGARVRIAVTDGQISFESDTHFVCSRLIGGEYPRYHELFPTDFSYLVQFKRDEMLAAVDRVAVMSDERTNLIKLHFEADMVQVSSNTPDVGKAQEEVACRLEGQVLDVAVNVRYVQDVLNKLSSEEVRLEMTGPLKPLIFKGETEDNYKYLLMPVQAR
ncbi:MAG: DNA polymerase III subunit beta [Candidatus Obscuribacterales bacterium]|nr:DNA polymerase III subunit beta [Candidatus Obscuribacterales bacterium]